jgi:membrane-associated phospholipid phosphatase
VINDRIGKISMRLRGLAVALLAVHAAAGTLPCAAQTTQADSSGGSTLFDPSDLYWAGGFVAATVAMAPLDRWLAARSQDSILQSRALLRAGSTGVRLLASPGGLVLGSAVYAGGKIAGSRETASLGLHTVESVLIADAITGVVKNVAGRERPRFNRENSFAFHFLGGFKGDDYRSFPSGHTTSAFAAAAAASEEVGQLWPAQKTWVSVLVYGAAGLGGISRIYNNAHWASDVVVGAGIGAFTGWKVVRYSYNHPNNSVDRFFLGRKHGSDDGTSATLLDRSQDGWVPDRGGIPIGFSIRTH